MDMIITDFFQRLDGSNFDGCSDSTNGSSSCVECFKSQYYKGNTISYTCEEKRKLYVLRYLPAHVAEIKKGLSRILDQKNDEWFECDEIKILSLGGGPGTDAYALMLWLDENLTSFPSLEYVEIHRVDMEPMWDEIVDELMGSLSGEVEYSLASHHIDVANGLDQLGENEFDLVIVSYLISELSTQETIALSGDVQSLLKRDGVLIVNDRSEEPVVVDIEDFFKNIGMKVSKRVNTEWAGYSYSPEISEVVLPKFKMSSVIYWGEK